VASYKLTPRAQQDLRDIWFNIAAENEPAADNLLNRLFEKFQLVALHPEMGPARPEIAATVRLIIEGRYIAIYEPAPYGILIIAIVHGMRDPSQWLS
jgi:plasmid stabilization system protein ParE